MYIASTGGQSVWWWQFVTWFSLISLKSGRTKAHFLCFSDGCYIMTSQLCAQPSCNLASALVCTSNLLSHHLFMEPWWPRGEQVRLRSGFEPCHRLVSLDKKLCSTMSLFTQVCKWVPAAYCWESPPAMDWHPVQRGVTLLAGASWHRNWNNLQSCELHGLKCTFTFSYQYFSSVGCCYEHKWAHKCGLLM